MSEPDLHSPDAHRLDTLLQPSLQDSVRAASIFSVHAGFMVAFFGGGFAAVLFGALNSRRLGRLGQDAWLYALATIFFGGYAVAAGYALGADAAAADWMRDNRQMLRIVARVLSLVLFGGIFFVHRRFYKAAELSAEESPSPWVPGIGACLAGTVISLVLSGAGALVAR